MSGDPIKPPDERDYRNPLLKKQQYRGQIYKKILKSEEPWYNLEFHPIRMTFRDKQT